MNKYNCIDVTYHPNAPKQNHTNSHKLLIFMRMTQSENVKIALDLGGLTHSM